VLGAGVIAGELAHAIRLAEGARLVAAASSDPARASALQPDRVYGSYEELLADRSVTAVYIATRTADHAAWVGAALDAGKHVLAEKPLAVDAVDVTALQAAAGARGLLLVEAMWWRWHPRTAAATALLRDGAVGRVRHVAAGFTFAGGAGWRLGAPAQGGGALLDVGCYAVSGALWAVGAAPSAVAARTVRRSAAGGDLATEVLLDWSDGTTAELRCAMDEPPGQWLVVTGDRGAIELSTPWTSREWAPCELAVSDGTGTRRVAYPPVPTYRSMVEEVSAALTAGRPALVTPAESLAVATVLGWARDAADRG